MKTNVYVLELLAVDQFYPDTWVEVFPTLKQAQIAMHTAAGNIERKIEEDIRSGRTIDEWEWAESTDFFMRYQVTDEPERSFYAWSIYEREIELNH